MQQFVVRLRFQHDIIKWPSAAAARPNRQQHADKVRPRARVHSILKGDESGHGPAGSGSPCAPALLPRPVALTYRSARRACPHPTDGDPRRRSRATRRDRAEPPPHPWRGGCVPAHHLRVARSAAGGASSPSSIGGRDRWVMGPDRSTETPTGRNETGCRCVLLHFVHGEPNRPHGTERAACNRREGGDH